MQVKIHVIAMSLTWCSIFEQLFSLIMLKSYMRHSLQFPFTLNMTTNKNNMVNFIVEQLRRIVMQIDIKI